MIVLFNLSFRFIIMYFVSFTTQTRQHFIVYKMNTVFSLGLFFILYCSCIMYTGQVIVIPQYLFDVDIPQNL